MVNVSPYDVDALVEQVDRLKEADCEIVRLAVPDEEAAKVFGKVRKRVNLPLIADIHFDYRLAIAAIDAGADGLRINPGNIGSRKKVERVVKAAAEKNVPIRIGVNAGSISKDKLKKHGGPPVAAMVESAMEQVSVLEALNFEDRKSVV